MNVEELKGVETGNELRVLLTWHASFALRKRSGILDQTRSKVRQNNELLPDRSDADQCDNGVVPRILIRLGVWISCRNRQGARRASWLVPPSNGCDLEWMRRSC